jgi:cytochrome P450
MPAESEISSITVVPAWPADQLDSAVPPLPEAPFFDADLNAWIFTRHADILSAFRSPGLFPVSLRSATPGLQPSEADHQKMRTETAEALPNSQLASWRKVLLPAAETLVAQFTAGEPIDLLEAYARPLCLSLAARVTGISAEAAGSLCETARRVSAASAEPFDPALQPVAERADEELKKHFRTGPQLLRDSTFVALSQTMPCLLGNAWYALIQHPEQWTLLHRQPELVENAIEELLRYAGLVRILTREAGADIDLNGTRIRKGQRIVLRVIAGNRDPQRFSCPSKVDIRRRDGGHLALGAGPHSCVGASLIRMTAITLTQPLVQRFASANLASTVSWQGGSGFRSPRALRVNLESNPENKGGRDGESL